MAIHERVCGPVSVIPDALRRPRANARKLEFDRLRGRALLRWSGIFAGKLDVSVRDPVLAAHHFVLRGTRDDGRSRPPSSTMAAAHIPEEENQ